MLRKIALGFFLFLLSLVLLIVGLFAYWFWLRPSQSYPYPYIFNFNEKVIQNKKKDTFAQDYLGVSETDAEIQEEKNEVTELGPKLDLNKIAVDDYGKVLIIGDRLGAHMSLFGQTLSSILSEGLVDPIKVTSIAKEKEGLHRTLVKIKNIKKYPKVIIYQGGFDEFYEKVFYLGQYKKFISNYDNFKDERVRTVIEFFPLSAKFFYRKMKLVELGSQANQDVLNYPDELRPRQIEMALKLYEYEVEDMIRTLQKQKVYIILISTPLNLSVMPKGVCNGATSDEIMALQNQAFTYMKNNDYKMAFNDLKKLIEITPGNALSYYLYGQTLVNLGQLEEGIAYLEHATVLDCKPWRGNMAFNAILKNMADKFEVPYVDFHSMIQQFYQDGPLFLDEIYPNNIFYEELMKIVAKKIKKYLRL